MSTDLDEILSHYVAFPVAYKGNYDMYPTVRHQSDYHWPYDVRA